VARIWTDTFGIQDTSLKTPLVTDSLFNTFIAGTVQNPTSGVDVLLRKLDAHGDLIWQSTYTNSGTYRDQATDIALDDSGNVYLCGASYINGNHFDFLVLKFDPNGNLLWDYTYNGSASLADGATALALSNGSVFVTGAATFTGSYIDYLTLRLSASGSLQWQSTYNYVNFADVPFDIEVQDGHVFVTGGSQNNFSDWDYATLQLLETNGSAVDTSRTGGTGIGFEYATEAVMDNNGNYYLTGTFYNNGSKDFKTIKFDANLNVVWAQSFDFDGEDDEAFSVAVDTSGNVYVAGLSSDSSNQQFTIVKYSNTGSQQWVHRSGGINNDRATRIACDESGNIFATGQRHNGFNFDFYTLALDEQGNVQWSKLFNGGSNGDDKANMIAVEDQYIIVSGTTTINGHQEYISIAYGTFKMSLPPDTGNIVSSSPNWFYPQSGQILDDTLGTADIQYYTLHHGPALFLKNEILSFVWAKTDTSSSTSDTLQRIDQVIVNAQGTRIYEYEESESFLNYYLAHCVGGIANVKGFKWLSIPDVYRNVNLYYTFNQGGIKQAYVSMPGTKPTIELKYLGADTLLIDTIDGSLEIKGSIGSMKFSRPYAYEIDAQGNIIPGTVFYPAYHQISLGRILIDNITYNTSNALVVVMEKYTTGTSPLSSTNNLFWSTMFGSTLADHAYSIDVTANNESVVAGSCEGLNFPTLTNSTNPLNINSGGSDCFLIYFDNNARDKFYTFFGGTNFDQVNQVIIDDDLQIHLIGMTRSSDFTSVSTSSPNDNSYNGGSSDGFYVKIDADNSSPSYGGPIIDSYIGGVGEDNITSIFLASNDHLLLGGFTNDEDGIPFQNIANATSNYYQDFYAGGDRDGLIVEFDQTGNINWCTLFGGNGDDFVTDVKINGLDKPVFAGLTNSAQYTSDPDCETPTDFGFPRCPPDPTIYPNGYVQTTNNGNYDAFVAQFDFSNNRGLIWCTFAGGAGNEGFENIPGKLFGFPRVRLGYASDEATHEDVFIAGITSSTTFFSQFPSAISGGFNMPYGGGIADGYILKFFMKEPIWSTYYGSSGDEDGITDIDYSNYKLTVCGNATGNTNYNGCSANMQGGFTICNLSGTNYIENYSSVGNGVSTRKACLAMFSDTKMLWSTRYNTSTGLSSFTGVKRNGNALFFCGTSFVQNYTFQDWDATSTLDLLQTYNLGQTDAAIVRFDVEETIAAGKKVEGSKSENTITLFPNPATDQIFIETKEENLNLVIFDSRGNIISEFELKQGQSTIPLKDKSSGIYLFRFYNQQTSQTFKVNIQ
jgi:hypothetical protein